MKPDTMLLGMTTTMLLPALPAAASDYTLRIFGNANEGDTINMQDATRIKRDVVRYVEYEEHWM